MLTRMDINADFEFVPIADGRYYYANEVDAEMQAQKNTTDAARAEQNEYIQKLERRIAEREALLDELSETIGRRDRLVGHLSDEIKKSRRVVNTTNAVTYEVIVDITVKWSDGSVHSASIDAKDMESALSWLLGIERNKIKAFQILSCAVRPKE